MKRRRLIKLYLLVFSTLALIAAFFFFPKFGNRLKIQQETAQTHQITLTENGFVPDTLTINRGDQIIFKYSDESGNITEEANLNGSLMNIAGICNATRNVYGMMPHPERASEDLLGNKDGLILFQSMIHYLASVQISS